MERAKRFRASTDSSRSGTPTKSLLSSAPEPAADVKRKATDSSTTVATKKPRLDNAGASPTAGSSSSARYSIYFFLLKYPI